MMKFKSIFFVFVCLCAALPALAQYTGGHEDGYAMASMQAQVVGISENESSDLDVYPNPAKADGEVIIKGEFSDDVRVSVIDVFGRELRSFSFSSNEKIVVPLTGISSGMYLVSLETNGAKRFTKIYVGQ